MPCTKLLPYDPDLLYRELLKHGDTVSLAKSYELPLWFVKYELWVSGIAQCTPPPINPELSRWPVEVLRKDLREHKSLKSLAKAYRCDLITLREALLVTGIFPRAWTRRKYNWIEQDLRKDLLACSNVRELMLKYGCGRSVLMRAFAKFGITIPSEKRASATKGLVFTREQLVADYDELHSLLAISKKYHCSIYKIWYNFNVLNIAYKRMAMHDCKDSSRKSRIAMNVSLLEDRVTDSYFE